MEESHATAPTAFRSVDGARIAHRRLGDPAAACLLLVQDLRSTMDDWDPALVGRLASRRCVVTFDGRGVGGSTGVAPNSVAAMAPDCLALADALAIPRMDVLGFGLGGMIAQQVLFDRPDRVRRVVLAGTGGPGAAGMFGAAVVARATEVPPRDESLLFTHFTPSTASQAAGARHLQRLRARKDRVPPTSRECVTAQLAAVRSWADVNGEAFARLRRVTRPVLVVGGAHDALIPAFNAFALSQQVPDAQLILYPDAGHGVLCQEPQAVADDALRFLERE